MARNKFDIDETLEAPFSLRHFKRSGVYIKRYKWKMILAFVLSLIATVASLVVVKLTAYILDKAIPAGDIGLILLIGLGLIGCIIVSIILSLIRMRVMAKVGQHIVSDIRMDVYVHLQKLSFSYYDSRPHGKILVRVIQYVNSVADMLSNGIINFLLEIFNIVIIATFMLTTSLQLSLVTFAGLPLILVVAIVLKPMQSRFNRNYSNKSSNMNAFIGENLNGVKVTQLFAREEYNANIYSRLIDAYRAAWMNIIKIGNYLGFSVENVSTWVNSMIYIAGILWISPTVTVGVLVEMTGYASRFWNPILSLANIYNSFMNTIAYLERIFETMDEIVDIADAEGAQPLPPIQGVVEFKNVVFEYDPGVTILKGISFRAEAGQSVALVGPTGAGKTTVVNLISRFYDIKSGQILIDGHDISKCTVQSLRSQMGIMMQDSFVFSGTVASNISYGKLDATTDEIQRAAHTVRADHFIEQMPKGYNTELTEKGGGLSQGQKQLLSFARTIVSDPQILILDEATSSIDTKTERSLQEGIERMMKKRTSFIIAHRLSTIQNCDKILYIDNGEIVEEGSHEELMAAQGAYYRLVMYGHQETTSA